MLQPSDLKAGKRPLTNGRFGRTATARRPQPTHEETLWCHFWLPAHKSSMSGSAPCKAPGAQVMAAFGVQISRIAENYLVIEEVMREVERIRNERSPIESRARAKARVEKPAEAS